ncbi:MAG: hypothetical protein HYV26_08280 [Candidatus Hydrogenedentes bacterium]|nr:hypothetical protein [Candidatus Hydrogenedentota bacterium]
MDAPQKIISNLPLRTKILYGLLLAVALGYVGLLIQTKMLEKELTSAAQSEIAKIQTSDNELTYNVSVSKALIFMGQPTGTVEIFVRQKGTPDARVHAVQLYFMRNDGTWAFDGSGVSVDDASHEKGTKAFAKRPAV